jgi:SAM-dependent methyltransferase
MTVPFYDDLAPFYHLLYPDWEASIARQGAQLASLLTANAVVAGASLLDAACGIGTQTIGLEQHGFRVRASDISTNAVARARRELLGRGLPADVHVADLRALELVHPGGFAAVLACDNAIPHLLSDAEITVALESCRAQLVPGGPLVISVRDYAAIERRNHEVRPYRVHVQDGHRFLAVQVWDWDGDQYDMRLYLTDECEDGACVTRMLRSRYYAITITRLTELMQEAGFVNVTRDDAAFFQPLLIGFRAPAA